MRPEQYIDLIIKGTAAFFVTLAWAIILYHPIKKFKKSWPSLMITVLVFTSFTFILKERMDKINPYFDQYLIYGLGILFGITLLSSIFNSKNKWFETPPKDDTFKNKYNVKKRIRLRDVIQAAIVLEDESKDFYNKLAEKAIDPKKKKYTMI